MLRRVGRWLVYAGGALVLLVLVALVLTWASTEHFTALGGRPSSASLARIQGSPQFSAGQFVNPEPTALMKDGAGMRSLRDWWSGEEMRVPNCPLPMTADTAARLATPPASGLRVTWLGHSTTLIELDGARLLTDPVWSERASPSTWVGPRRFHPPPLALADLPALDAVLISHEHYDHLDMNTVRALAVRGVPFHVPLGIGGHLTAWGVPAAQIVEHDWWDASTLPGRDVRVVSTPARHFNGRGVPWRLGALWTSWSIAGPHHRAFFSGDTGPTESLREIARRQGPFDVALIEIGQYHPSWGAIHLGPLGALDALARVGARVMIPIHWATFQLAYHAWSEPAETLVREAARRGAPVLTPRLGQPIEPTVARAAATAAAPDDAAATMAWWRALPPIAAGCP